MLTRCPHCTASFRVSDAQLQAAHGKVRCGACMQIFNAAEHLLTDETPPANSNSEDMLEGLEQDDDFATLAEGPADDAAGLSRSQSITSTPSRLAEAAQSAEDDQHDFSETFKDLNQYNGAKQSFHAEIDSEKVQSNSSNRTSPASSIKMQENANEAPVKNPLVKKLAKDSRTKSKTSGTSGRSEAKLSASRPARDPEPDHQIIALRADPVSIKPTFRVDRSGEWPGKLAWAALIFAVLAFIIAQLAWFQFEDLARHNQLRPYYKKACQMLGCNLPSLYDISLVRSQNLVVRSHPLVSKALIIDAIVVNQAAFEQPFPDIALTFSDIDKNVIAKREFSPGEYLSGEAKTMRSMPTNAPIHIALEILDPGKEAVNYNMGFVENKAYLEAE